VFVLDEELRTLPLAAIHLPTTPESDPNPLSLSTGEVPSISLLPTQPTPSSPPSQLASSTQRPRFLIDQYSVGMVPSMSLFDTRYVSLRGLAALVVGNSEFADIPGLDPVRSLPNVPLETALISEIYPTSKILPDGLTLDKQALEQQRQSFELVHLATHGFFKPGPRTNSYLRLGSSKLTLEDISQFQWQHPPVQLLVLSACKTAVGDPQAELGFGGLSVYAGVKTAIATLWNVDDGGATALVAEFYSQLSKVPIRAEALRRAQVALRDGTWKSDVRQLLNSANAKQPLLPQLLIQAQQLLEQDFSHPYYWAGFTMIGYPW
jgi:CHAT domain-containing protein